MIHIADEDIVVRRDTLNGRFVLFTRTDLPEKHPLPWTGAMLDTGGDGFGLAVSLNPDCDPASWWSITLIAIALERARQEEERRPGLWIQDQIYNLKLALTYEYSRIGQDAQPVIYQAGQEASPYGWTEILRPPHQLALCPDPLGDEPGISQEQILLVLAQTYADAHAPTHQHRLLRRLRDVTQGALEAERRRLLRLRP